MLKKEEQIEKIKKEIGKIEKKENKILFFTPDTKGNPSSSIQFIYRMALALKNKKYNVGIVHQDNEFIGPFEWLGEEFKEIPHFNSEKENVEVSPSDVLIIPEIYSNIFYQIKTLPCKKIVLFQNFEHLTEFMPLSTSLGDCGINEAITTSEVQKEYILKCFPYLKVHVLNPGISNMFRPQKEPKKLIVNIISKDQTKINQIIKPFYWRFPVYKWVSFRDLRGMTQEVFANALREAPITIWIDEETNFGYSAIEALKSGAIILGKLPENPVDWMLDKDGNLIKDILWFDKLRTLPELIASLVRSWTLDSIPDDVYTGVENFKNKFTLDDFNYNIGTLFSKEINEKRKEDFEEVLKLLENNEENIEEK